MHTQNANLLLEKIPDSYQVEGAEFLVNAKRAILADDVGLGKTLQAILACRRCGGRVLVITKKSPLIHNWLNEISECVPDLSCDVYSTTKDVVPDTDFVVTNYEAAMRRIDVLLKQDWSVLIVDEAQYVKNRKAKRTKAIYKLAHAAEYVWLLTATPLLNRPDELWSLLHILYPQKYRSYWRFVDEYCLCERNFWGGTDILGVKNHEKLASEIRPIMLRRTKEILNLPPLTQETMYIPLEGKQKTIYQEMKKHFIAVLDEAGDQYISAPSVLAQLTRLRQIVCTPALVGGPDQSGKTDALLELLSTYADCYKILVFTTFAQYARNIHSKIAETYGAEIITGEMNSEARWDAASRFQNCDDCRVLIGTIGTIGEGVNLQQADIVIFLNQDWVPANMEIQAIGRAHRRGRTRPVHVINLVVRDTVDEYIHRVVLPRKRDVIREVLRLLREG